MVSRWFYQVVSVSAFFPKLLSDLAIPFFLAGLENWLKLLAPRAVFTLSFHDTNNCFFILCQRKKPLNHSALSDGQECFTSTLSRIRTVSN